MDYYVYALIDPRTSQPFYIGKGKGNRYKAHLTETKDTTINIKKFNKIQSIRSCGLEPLVDIIRHFENEEDAYLYEEFLISTTPDLTNIQPGGKGGAGSAEWKINNPSSKTKGMTYEERYGPEKAIWMRQVRSEQLKGRKFSDESKQRMSDSAMARDHTYKQKTVTTPLGVFTSLHEAAVAHGISDSAMCQRLNSPKHPESYRGVFLLVEK